ncbi:hypothetical protein CLI75_12205, partial [Porphyromonas gingivalis]
MVHSRNVFLHEGRKQNPVLFFLFSLLFERVDKDGTADRRNPIFEDHWLSIYANPDVGAKLNCLIGREKIVH